MNENEKTLVYKTGNVTSRDLLAELENVCFDSCIIT